MRSSSPKAGPTPERRAAERRGRRAEWLAVLRLRLAGYRILMRGWRVPSGEIDIIARRGRTLVMVEVKARGTWANAAEAVSARQQARISRASSHFLAAHPEHGACDIRFDVVLVIPGRWPRHLRGAWIAAG